MTTIIPTGPGSIRKNGGAVFAALALTGAIGFFAASPAEGKDPDEVGSLKTTAEIEALAIRYAEAADAIGRGDVEEGRQIIKTCFADDAAFKSFLPSQDPNTPPVYSLIGPDAWTDATNALLIANGYTGWQHYITNIQITVQGNMASMKSYLAATLVLDWSSSMDFVTGTYTDDLVLTPNGWRIAQRSLHVTSFLRIDGSPPPLP